MSHRCPACWSFVEPSATICPHCGASIAGRRSRIGRLGVALVVVVAAIGTFWALRERDRNGSDAADFRPGTASGSTPNADPAADPDTPPSPTADPLAGTPLLVVRTRGAAEDGAVTGLVLRRWSGSPALLVPLVDLPRRGRLELENGQSLDRVLDIDEAGGAWALLELPLGAATVEARAGDAGASARAVHPRITQDAATAIETDRATGLLRVAPELPRGAALLDEADPAVAIGLTLGNGRAIAAARLRPWLETARAGEPFAAVIARLRARDPALLLEDVRALLAGSPSPASLTRALDDLDLAIGRGRDAATIDALTAARLRVVTHLIGVLGETAPQQALERTRAAHVRHGDDPGLLAYVAQLEIAIGDADRAIAAFRRLANSGTAMPTSLADGMATAFTRAGDRRVVDERYAEALRILEPAAVEFFPGRADVRIAYARALRAAGRLDLALAEGDEAARLDPAWREEVRRWRESGRAGEVVIRFRPGSSSIRTRIRVGGIPLRVVVDTGASLTTIPSRVADRLGLRSPSNRRITLQTASGNVESELVRVPELKIGTAVLRDVEAAVLDLPKGMQEKGLLGMSALREFAVSIDHDRGELILRPRGSGGR